MWIHLTNCAWLPPWIYPVLPVEHVLHEWIRRPLVHLLIGAVLSKNLVKVKLVLHKKVRGTKKRPEMNTAAWFLSTMGFHPWTLRYNAPAVYSAWDPPTPSVRWHSHTVRSAPSPRLPLLSCTHWVLEVFSSRRRWSAGPLAAWHAHCNHRQSVTGNYHHHHSSKKKKG